MGMSESPCNGYTIEVRNLRPSIVVEHRTKFDELLEECDAESLMKLITEHSIAGSILPESVFQLNDEDTGDETMQSGEVYAIYDQSQLYTLQLKPEAKGFERLIGPLPTQRSWTIFG